MQVYAETRRSTAGTPPLAHGVHVSGTAAGWLQAEAEVRSPSKTVGGGAAAAPCPSSGEETPHTHGQRRSPSEMERNTAVWSGFSVRLGTVLPTTTTVCFTARWTPTDAVLGSAASRILNQSRPSPAPLQRRCACSPGHPSHAPARRLGQRPAPSETRKQNLRRVKAVGAFAALPPEGARAAFVGSHLTSHVSGRSRKWRVLQYKMAASCVAPQEEAEKPKRLRLAPASSLPLNLKAPASLWPARWRKRPAWMSSRQTWHLLWVLSATRQPLRGEPGPGGCDSHQEEVAWKFLTSPKCVSGSAYDKYGGGGRGQSPQQPGKNPMRHGPLAAM
nr:uncharacterized protein LOC110129691 [Odocoileus virginianus texanus]